MNKVDTGTCMILLIQLKNENASGYGEIAHFSRPGSAYGMRPQMQSRYRDPSMVCFHFKPNIRCFTVEH